MSALNVYDHIESNNFKTFLLIILFPLSFIFIFSILFYVAILLQDTPELMNFGLSLYRRYFNLSTEINLNLAKLLSVVGYTISISIPMIIVAFLWLSVSYFFGDNMMLKFAGATEIFNDDMQYKKAYRIVEDTAIRAGLPMPRVYLVDDDSLNAFATGRNPENASIALTKGIINKLDNLELEGVVAHEMAHIGNRDIRLDMMIITGVGVFGFLADIVSRHFFNRNKFRRSKSDSGGGIVILIIVITWVALLIFNVLIAPLIRMAVSRVREYNADATGALITRNPAALASALEKIGIDSRVEILDKKDSMGISCISDPRDSQLLKGLNSLTSSHPAIESRIARLRNM